MKKPLLRLTALGLSLLLLAGCGKQGKTGTGSVSTAAAAVTASPAAAPEATAAPTASPAPTETPAPLGGRLDEDGWPSADGIHADVSYEDMQWYLYDMTEFNDRAERLSETADESEAEELYSWLLTEYDRLQTLDELAWIDFYARGSEEASERCQVTDELLTQAADTLHSAVSDVLAAPEGEEFSSWLGEEESEALSDYEEMTDRELELLNRETELTLEYNDLMAREDLSVQGLGEEAGGIFLELIAIRNELASLYGYDTFAEFAYEVYYERDYTPADAAALCAAIHPYAQTYFEDCCYCDAFYTDMGPTVDRTPEELLSMLREYAPRISPLAEEAERYMEEHGLYLLGKEGEISDLGFTATLEYYNAPFLYNCLYGEIYDIQGMFHEFGHYCDAYLTRSPNPLIYSGSYDIFEIHSTGLEALSYFWYDEIFGDKAEEARIWCLDGLIGNVVNGCIYDEFQQYVYSHPDLSVEEVCDVYLSIREAYGQPTWSEEERYDWIYVNHNFESPFYYISYAASALASLQIWSRADRDYDAALELYNDLVALGAYDMGYCQLLEEVGLNRFTEDPESCFADAFRHQQSVCMRYDGKIGMLNLPSLF